MQHSVARIEISDTIGGMTRCSIYARSSVDCPLSAKDQTEHLKAVATEHGWTVAQVFIDRQTSVKKQDRRPGEVALLAAIRAGAVDRVLIWSIDRIGRSLAELVGFLETCRLSKVSLWVAEQRIDTDQSPVLFDAAAWMALHLRQSRRDRILRGQAAARVLSIRFGRPPIPPTKTEKARRALAVGKGIRETARLIGVSPTSISRIKSTMNSASTVD
jgi:DNA invertase Pin-like site-specific DNA recombinase